MKIEQELGMKTFPINWPIGSGDRFQSVFDCFTRAVHLFERRSHGSQKVQETILTIDDPKVEEYLETDLYLRLLEDLELLAKLGEEFDLDKIHDGKMTPVFLVVRLLILGCVYFLIPSCNML